MNTLTIHLEYSWQPVLDESGEHYRYPDSLDDYLRDRLNGPAVYRWLLMDDDSPTGVFIGETDDLPRRIYSHINPNSTQQALQKVKSTFVQRAFRGEDIRLETLVLSSFVLNGKKSGPLALKNRALRRTLEQVLLSQALEDGVAVLNG